MKHQEARPRVLFLSLGREFLIRERGRIRRFDHNKGMISCGEEFERRVVAGERYAFANMVNAMREKADEFLPSR